MEDNSSAGCFTLTYAGGSVGIFQQASASQAFPIVYAPVGDAAPDGSSLAMTAANNLVLTDADGTTTTWQGGTGHWQVASVTQPGQSGSTTAYFRGAISNPADQLSVPAGTLVTRIIAASPVTGCTDATADTTIGCRSLKLVYDYAPGSTSQVRLVEVDLSAYDPQANSGAGAMRVVPVAAYDYYASGQLKDAYDPRLSPHAG